MFREYLKLLYLDLREYIYGIHMYNSVVDGSYVDGSSDIGFIIILNKELRLYELVKLCEIHRHISFKYKSGSRMIGGYVLYPYFSSEENSSCSLSYTCFEKGKLIARGELETEHSLKTIIEKDSYKIQIMDTSA